MLVQPLDVLIAESHATVCRRHADRVLVRRAVEQEAVAEDQTIFPELALDLAVLRAERRNEERFVEYDVLVRRQRAELAVVDHAHHAVANREAAAVAELDRLAADVAKLEVV